MSKLRSDRARAFHQMVTHVRGETEAAGIYLSDVTQRYLDGAFPLEVKHGEAKFPRSYNPENGPPVLMLLPGEKVNMAIPTRVYNKVAELVVSRTAVDVELDAPNPGAFTTECDHDMGLRSFSVSMERNGKNITSLWLPLFIAVATADGPQSPSNLPHELDHWDFFLSTTPKLHTPSARVYSNPEVETLAERRAYKVSYAIENDLGYHALLPSPQELAEAHNDSEPAVAGRAMCQGFRAVRRSAGLDFVLPLSAVAVALESLYRENNDELAVHPSEVIAYEAAGLLGRV